MANSPYVFISYGHLDNVSEDEQGWINRFRRDLGWRISQLFGEQIEVWQDTSLDRSQPFSDQILEKIRAAAVLVPVVTPRYLRSEWCQRELQAFLEESRAGVNAKHPFICKVVKTPVDLKREPEVLQQTLGFPFYREDELGVPRAWPFPDEDGDRKYAKRLDELALEIRKMIEAKNTPVNGSHPEKLVYLAETSGDMTPYRDELKRELVARGCAILPDRPLPLESEPLQDEVKADLAACALSLHLVGSRFGFVPDGENVTESAVSMQARLSVERAEDKMFRSLIWHPPNVELKDVRQIHFLETLQSSLGNHKATEFLRVPFEGFKTHVVERLTPPPPPPPEVQRSHKWIYLVCEAGDFQAARGIQRELEGLGYEVDLPAREGDAAGLRSDHEQLLRDCDAVLIYYGAGSEAWVREKCRDLKRAPAFGRTRKFTAQGILTGPPESQIKQEFHNPALTLDRGGVGGTAVAPVFLRVLETS